jgi:hypothetical protein
MSKIPAEEFGDSELRLRAALEPFPMQQLQRAIHVNSVPKCGTYLLRNVLLSFVGFASSDSLKFVENFNIRDRESSFAAESPKYTWGHVNHIDEAVRIIGSSKILVLVRDPYDYVLSMTRFFYSEQEDSKFARYVKAHKLSVDRVISFVIFGNYNDENLCVGVKDQFIANAVAWMAGDSMLVRYEELLRHCKNPQSPESLTYFRELLAACGLELPADWRDRVRLAASPRFSWTARENLQVSLPIPNELSFEYRTMVELAAPGLRRALGYM